MELDPGALEAEGAKIAALVGYQKVVYTYNIQTYKRANVHTADRAAQLDTLSSKAKYIRVNEKNRQKLGIQCQILQYFKAFWRMYALRSYERLGFRIPQFPSSLTGVVGRVVFVCGIHSPKGGGEHGRQGPVPPRP